MNRLQMKKITGWFSKKNITEKRKCTACGKNIGEVCLKGQSYVRNVFRKG